MKDTEKMNRLKWLRSRLSKDDLGMIEEAIRKAELNTSGEIIPLVVRRSSTIGHIPLTLILFFISSWLITDRIASFYTNRSSLDSPLLSLSALALILFLTAILTKREWVQRLLTPRYDQILQVNQRAEVEFFTSNIKKTIGSTGVLIMLSLMERRAVVLADKAVNDKLPPETWNKVIEEIISQVKNKNIAEGMVVGIKLCGEILAQNLPILPDDTNELANHLVIKE